MPEPIEQPDFDELLSAYVDGELQGDELARVEQRLATDPAARQLVDELRALSGELKSLPTESVGESLRSSVMQRAERAMLLGSAEPPTVPNRQSQPSRRWVWAAMAVAATLLLSVALPSFDDEEPAIADATPPPAGNAAGEMRIEAIPQPAMEELLDAADAETASVSEPDSKEIAAAPAATTRAGHPASAQNFAMKAGQPTIAAADADGAATDPFDVSQVTCEVHITMGDGLKSVEQFDRVLAKNYIIPEKQGADLPRDSAKDEAVDSEFVLVEAPVAQIDDTLADCNLDTFNCPKIEIVEQSDSPPPVVTQLRQWERGANEMPAKRSQARSKIAIEQQMGRAIRLDQAKLKQSNLFEQKDRQRAMTQKMALSKKIAGKDLVRVLFVLQQAADLRKPVEIKSEASGQP